MNDGFIIVTNNPLVQEKYHADYNVDYEELSFEDTLKKVQKQVYLGHKLLTHPLSGSVKPNETPYKSIMISVSAGDLDLDSANLIENAIGACSKFEFKSDRYAPEVYKDFQLVDYTLITSAIPSAECWT